MAYIKVFVADDQLDQILTLSKVYQTSVATLMRPYASGAIAQLWANYTDVLNRPLHQRVVKIAMEHSNTTIKEISDFTGLERCIVTTTVSEMIELGFVRRHGGRGKIVNYFLKEKSDDDSEKISQKQKSRQ